MQIIKKIIIFLLVGNVFVLPISLYMVYQNFYIVSQKSNYRLKRVQVKEVVNLSSGRRGLKYTKYRLIYDVVENGEILESKVDLRESNDKFVHFMNSGKEDSIFGGFQPVEKNDSIWVWHNQKVKDFYALPHEKKFNTKAFWLQGILFILLSLIGFSCLCYHINELKAKKKLV